MGDQLPMLSAPKAPLPISSYRVVELESYSVHAPGDKTGVWVLFGEDGRPQCIQHGYEQCPHIEAVMPHHIKRAGAKAPAAGRKR